MAKCKFTGFAPGVARSPTTPTLLNPPACSRELPWRAAAAPNGAKPAAFLWRHTR